MHRYIDCNTGTGEIISVAEEHGKPDVHGHHRHGRKARNRRW
jgi:hypothetical protein